MKTEKEKYLIRRVEDLGTLSADAVTPAAYVPTELPMVLSLYEINMKHNKHWIGKLVKLKYVTNEDPRSSLRWLIYEFHHISGNPVTRLMCNHDNEEGNFEYIILNLGDLEIVDEDWLNTDYCYVTLEWQRAVLLQQKHIYDNLEIEKISKMMRIYYGIH